MKYTLYHIKGVKWGMTKRTLKQRLKEQGYTISDCCEVEYYDDIDVASNREIELNKLCGYKNQIHAYEKYIKYYENLHKYSPMNRLGHVKSKEHRENISKAKKGKPTNHKGNPEHILPYASKPGELNGNATINETIVKYIRAQFTTGKYAKNRIAQALGITNKIVYDVISYKSWKHI